MKPAYTTEAHGLPNVPTWLLVVGFIAAFLLGFVIAAGDDHRAEWPQADSLQDMQRKQAERDRRAQFARAICGPGADWDELGGGAIQCKTRHGRATITAQVQP